jgi:outer membrane usher protein
LFVDGQDRGTVQFEISPTGEPLLGLEQLRAALGGDAKPSVLDALGRLKGPAGPENLAPLGIKLSFDSGALVLSLDLDSADMAASTVDVLETAPPGKGEKVVDNAPFAVTLGTGLELDPSYTSTEGCASFSSSATMNLAPSVRAFGLVTEGNADMTYGQSGYSWVLNSAQVIKDFPVVGARLEGGTVDMNATSFQSAQEVYGVSFARDESLPGGARELGSLTDSFIIQRDAYVTVEVNGVIVKQLKLSPGNYRFSDLPLASGLNDVRIVIEEQGMSPRIVRLGVPFDQSLLGPGELDYSVSLGVLPGRDQEPFGAAHAAIGIGGFFQFGLNAEAGSGSALGGFSLLSATLLGTIGFDDSLSADGQRPSYAARAYWRFSNPSNRYAPQLGATAEYRAPGFISPSAGSSPDPGTLAFSTQAGETIPGSSIAVSLFGQVSYVGSAPDSWSGTMGVSLPTGRSLYLSLAGGYTWSSEAGPSPSVTLTVTSIRPRKGQITYNQTFSQGTDTESLAIGFDDQGRKSINADGDGLLTPGSDRGADLSYTQRIDAASFMGSGRWYQSGDGATRSLSGSLGASTTLAFADEVLGATSSPNTALAILVPSSELGGQEVDLSPATGAQTASASGKPGIVTGLVPYSDYTAGVELPQSPPDSRPTPSSVELKPEYRSISVVRVSLAYSTSVRGILVDERKAPLVDLSGDLVDKDGKVVPSTGTFSDDNGVFECYDLPPGPVTIRWSDGSVLSFVVPAGKPDTIVDLGDVTPEPGPTGGGQ